MKNKTKTYMLLVVAIGIWGTIGYKIWSGTNPGLPEDIPMVQTASFNPMVSTIIDTFSIQPLDRDPFLGKITSKRKAVRTSSPTKKTEEVYIPILYHGMIAKENSTEKLYIISIDNQQHFIKVGQVVKGIKLLKATNKEIKVRYKGVTKNIKKI